VFVDGFTSALLKLLSSFSHKCRIRDGGQCYAGRYVTVSFNSCS
jgi:hypothetical protein